MKRILFLVFLFAASVLQAAEFEVVDQLTVDGATILRSSVQVIVPNTVPSSLWVSTSAITPHLYVSTNGNVGIGTKNPEYQLQVNNNANLSIFGVKGQTAGIRLDDINVDGVKWQLDSGVEAAGKFTITHSGVGRRLTIDTGGNVGIGTTSPATKLHMSSGTLTIDGNVDTSINAVGDISAARYQINGSTMVAIL